MEAMRAAGVGLAIGDHPDRGFQTLRVDRRLDVHPPEPRRGGPDERYSPAELERWAERISEWRDRGDIYVYMNSDEDSSPCRDGEALLEMLG